MTHDGDRVLIFDPPRGCGGGRSRIPKGYFPVTVGSGEEQRRFVIPVEYLKHPLFKELLKLAEEKYEFQQKGLINIPCHVEVFCHVRGRIDEETTSLLRSSL